MTNEDQPQLTDEQLVAALEVLGITHEQFITTLAEGIVKWGPEYDTNELLLDMFCTKWVHEMAAATGQDAEQLWSMHVQDKPRQLRATTVDGNKVRFDLDLGTPPSADEVTIEPVDITTID
jgi:hypothetical protein